MLTFHRVLNDEEYKTTNSLPGMIMREPTFLDLARYLSENFQLVDLTNPEGAPLPGKARIACTFDDGWRDNYTSAFAILSQYGMPATIFICPGLLNQVAPFWPERHARLLRAANPDIKSDQVECEVERLKYASLEERESRVHELNAACSHVELAACDRTMSWGEISEMERSGIHFGSHSYSHPILTKVPNSVAREELERSKASMEKSLGQSCDMFAYPNGDWSPAVRDTVRDAGFKLAVSTQQGVWTNLCDTLTIPRCNVCESSVVGMNGRFSSTMFEYTILWRAWRGMRATTRGMSTSDASAADLRGVATTPKTVRTASPHS